MNNDTKFNLVKKAYYNAYAKYSDFKVGSIVILKDGNFIMGSNVENASFGLSNCAERSALFATYSLGYRKEDIKEIVIFANGVDFVYPCGACRQVISELMEKDSIVTLFKPNGESKQHFVKDLLPFSFTEDDLNVKRSV